MFKRTVEQHAAHLRQLIEPRLPAESETVNLQLALGRIPAADIFSPVDLPLFRNSQMDGFAVFAADLSMLPLTLPIVGEIAARPGTPPSLLPGTAVRIMTGAVVPVGADAVVPVEDTTSTENSVTINRGRTPGEFVRERGSDLHLGERLLPAGVRLASRHLAVLAAAGIQTVSVRRRVRVAIISTGAELAGAGLRAGPGEIYDSNSAALHAAVTECGSQVTQVFQPVGDELSQLITTVSLAAENADLILTSGGISMGRYEVVRELVANIGGDVGQVAMQPGGPQASALFNGVPLIGFPGNPVSAQISFEVFVAPILRAAAGLTAAKRTIRPLASALRSTPGKRQFLRGRPLPDGRVELVGGPGSHLVAGLAAAELLIDIAAETIELNEGDPVETIEL